MKTITITNARADLYNIVNETIESSQPVEISSKKGNVIMISADDWNALQETIYISSVKGLKEAIIEGGNTPIDECVEDIGWDLD